MNYLPTIEAYCTERVASIKRQSPPPRGRDDRIDELLTIIGLCQGLQKQHDIFSTAFNVPVTRRVEAKLTNLDSGGM
jgi:hypothetical protein